MTLLVAIHERLGYWARQLRPRVLARPVRWVETRSSADLRAAVAATACPIVVIDLAHWLKGGLEDLQLVRQLAPNALVLVLDPEAHAGLPCLARELGATHVFSGIVPPPDVAELLSRWLPLAHRRTEADGWSRVARPEPEPEPWNWLNPILADAAGTSQTPRP